MTISFVQNHFVEEYDPTIEDSYRKQIGVDDVPCILNILDTAGQEEYSAMRDQYMRTGHGFLLVFSLTTRASFAEAKSLHGHILQVKDLERVPLVLAGNKCDLPVLQVTAQEGEAAAALWGVPFLATSAKTRTNVDEVFAQLVREIRTHHVPDVDPRKKKMKCRFL